MGRDHKDDLGREQHYGEQSPHALYRVHMHILHIQSLFLVKTAAVLNPTAQTLIIIHGLDDGHPGQGHTDPFQVTDPKDKFLVN